MTEKVIALEKRDGPFQAVLQRVMRMVPGQEKGDKQLQRLLAFRLQVDGEAETIEYLMRHVRDYIQCNFAGSLYTFLTTTDRAKEEACVSVPLDPNPPDTA
ncbi:MAG: hypothetical protein JEZ11_14630 [Desulfobacterales bacterium]|nr:hypothetical protein [Desulfobacterales bacterium]